MRRRLRALRSLRWRLTASYVALLAALLTGLGAYQYVSLRETLITSRVNDFRNDLTTAKAVLRNSARSLTITVLANRAANAVTTGSGRTVSVVIYDSGGNRLTEARSEAQRSARGQLPQLDPAAMAAVAQRRVTETAVVDTVTGPELLAGFPLELPGSLHVVAQLSASMAPITDVLRSQLQLFVLASLLVLLLALAIGLFITNRSLRPLGRLTSTAGELAGGDLRARSRLMPRPDEIGQLTAAFDHMADSLETAFVRQAQSEDQMRRFIADASHELRTPVTALKGYIDVLRRGAGRDPEALDGALQAMGREAERMRLLVGDLLVLARIDARGTPSVEEFDLREAVGVLLDEGVPGMPPHLERRFPAEPVEVHCDRVALATIVRNLLGNACKYAPGAAQTWSVGIDEGRARIDVHDEGPGIPPSDLPHVFERFYRGEKTRSREEGGSGLGLSIVEGLVRAQGGDARVASVEGAGTTVSVWIPRSGPTVPAAQAL